MAPIVKLMNRTEPLFSVPTCLNCAVREKDFVPARKLSRCSRCNQAMYCSRECQLGDHKRHRLYCHLHKVVDLHDEEAPLREPTKAAGIAQANSFHAAVYGDLFSAMVDALQIGSSTLRHFTHTVILHFEHRGLNSRNPRNYFTLAHYEVVLRHDVRKVLEATTVGGIPDDLERQIDPANFEWDGLDPMRSRAVVWMVYSSKTSAPDEWVFQRPAPFALFTTHNSPQVDDWGRVLRLTLVTSRPPHPWVTAVWMIESGRYVDMLKEAGVESSEDAYEVAAEIWTTRHPDLRLDLRERLGMDAKLKTKALQT